MNKKWRNKVSSTEQPDNQQTEQCCQSQHQSATYYKFWSNISKEKRKMYWIKYGRLRLKCDGTCSETRLHLSAKRTSPFNPAGASVWSTTGSQGVHISGSNAGYTEFRGSVKRTGYHSIRQFTLHVPSRASPSAITFHLDSMHLLNYLTSLPRTPVFISLPWGEPSILT